MMKNTISDLDGFYHTNNDLDHDLNVLL